MKTLFERCSAVMPPAAGRMTQVGAVSAKGCYVQTDDGKTLLDFASGVAVCNVGHNHDDVIAAAKQQIDKMIHVGHNVLYYEPYVTLAEKLVELTGGDTMVYFSNSGAEANDGAIKLARYVTERPAVIAFKNAFHGRTIACTALTTSSAGYRKNYEGALSGVYFAEYANCYRCPFKQEKGKCKMECVSQFDDIFDSLVAPESVAAIILEPVQGEGGYIVPPAEFFKGLREICDKHGILLIYDEIQTGFGRTGNFFAYQTFGVKPDIFTSAKGIGNGFPLSAVIAKKEIMQKWPAGAHGGTFGGNPVACAASLATIKILENGAIENCRNMGKYFIDELMKLQKKYPDTIGEVRGVGLMIGIEIVDKDGNPDGKTTKKILDGALERNIILLFCGRGKNVIRFIAPTIVTAKEIDAVVKAIDEILAE